MDDYKQLYEKVGSLIGWDFSEIPKRVKSVGEKWQYADLVKGYLNKNTVLLDIGTGGGEVLLRISKNVKKSYGIDNSKSMITTAKKNLKKCKTKNVKFELADAEDLPFPEEMFDVVLCKHAPFYPEEVYKVLKEGGIFITQQVGEKDKQNIKEIFGRGQSFNENAGDAMKKYVAELKEEGFTILKMGAYNATEYYENMQDVVFLLKNTPIIPDFDIEKDYKFLAEIEDKYKRKKGIKTNSCRYVIVCKKKGLEEIEQGWQKKIAEYRELHNRVNKYWCVLVKKGIKIAKARGLITVVVDKNDSYIPALNYDIKIIRDGDNVDAEEQIALTSNVWPGIYKTYLERRKKHAEMLAEFKKYVDKEGAKYNVKEDRCE